MHRFSQQKAQRGSVFVIVLVLLVAGLGAWYLIVPDRIKRTLSPLNNSQNFSVELIELKCGGQGALGGGKGSVRNISSEPQQLTAFVLVKRGNFPDERLKAQVSPSPLQPGQSGIFNFETQFDSATDKCEVLYFLNGTKRLDYRKADGGRG